MPTQSNPNSGAEPLNASLRIFQIVAALGVGWNLAFTTLAFFMPEQMMRMLNLPASDANIWLRNAANLLLSASVFSIPAILDPRRFALVTWWVALGRFAGVIFWAFAMLSHPGVRGLMILLVDLVFGVVLTLLLQRGMAPTERLNGANVRRMLTPAARLTGSAGRMLKWFQITVGLGIALNLFFIAQAFFTPAALVKGLDLPPEAANIWLSNTAMLMLMWINAFLVAAMLSPARYPLYTWWVPGMRFSGALFWLHITDAIPGLMPYLITDLTLAVVQTVLLYRGLGNRGPISAD